MSKLTLQDLPLKGKKVLMRVDFNVPLNKDGSIADMMRIQEALPSIQYILNKGGSVILMSHLGRPKGRDANLSLKVVAVALKKLLPHVHFAPDCIGPETEKMAQELQVGHILLLENLRFHAAEEKPETDPSFAANLAKLGDFYVNDAFGTAHRAHSSTAQIASFFPGKSAAGLLMQKEISFLGSAFEHPKHPFYAIIGGAKISTKFGVLQSLISKVDGIFIGGGMSYTLFKAQGISIGDSIHEDSFLDMAKDFLGSCKKKNIKLWLPIDIVAAKEYKEDAESKIFSTDQGIPEGWQGLDIGPKTLERWQEDLKKAAMIFWNGPVGVFEFPRFAKGTEGIARALSALKAITIVGGGDSVAAINHLGLAKNFSHVSTGGGASLEYIELGHLPGIDALSDK